MIQRVSQNPFSRQRGNHRHSRAQVSGLRPSRRTSFATANSVVDRPPRWHPVKRNFTSLSGRQVLRQDQARAVLCERTPHRRRLRERRWRYGPMPLSAIGTQQCDIAPVRKPQGASPSCNGTGCSSMRRPRRLYERPASRFVADFVGEATLLDGRVESRASDQAPGRLTRAFRGRDASARPGNRGRRLAASKGPVEFPHSRSALSRADAIEFRLLDREIPHVVTREA